MVWLMAQGCLLDLMGRNMKVIGKMIPPLGLGQKASLTVLNTLETFNLELNKAKVDLTGLMEVII